MLKNLKKPYTKNWRKSRKECLTKYKISINRDILSYTHTHEAGEGGIRRQKERATEILELRSLTIETEELNSRCEQTEERTSELKVKWIEVT